MDDHPPSWHGNGARYLHPIGLQSSKTRRVNAFLAKHEGGAEVDALAVARGLVENFSVQELELHRCGVDGDGATGIAQALSVNKYLRALGLSRNAVHGRGGASIADSLKVNQTLTSLDLSWNGLTDDAIACVAESLLVNNSLLSLRLDRNSISCDGAGAIATALGGQGGGTANRKLRHLSLSGNKIQAAGCSILGRCVASPGSVLASLDLSGNGIPQAGMFSLFQALASAGPASRLQSLNVAYNHVGDAVALLGLVVARCPGLRELCLERTRLAAGPHWAAFCRALYPANGGAAGLVNLSVASNEALGDAGVAAFADAVAGRATPPTAPRGAHAQPLLRTEGGAGGARPALRWLDVTETGVKGGAAVQALAAAVAACPHLHTLHLSHNDLSAAGAAVGELASVEGGGLRFLGLGHCRLGAAGVEAFAGRLRYAHAPLTGLSLRHNGCGGGGLAHLLPVVLHTGRLEFLDLAGNGLTPRDVDRLHDVFEANPGLPYVVAEDSFVVTRANLLQLHALFPDDFPSAATATADSADAVALVSPSSPSASAAPLLDDGRHTAADKYRRMAEAPSATAAAATTAVALATANAASNAERAELRRAFLPDRSLPPPPLVAAATELDPSTLEPSAAIATYSLAVGSSTRRQYEAADGDVQRPLTRALEFAGKPVRHWRTWAPSEEAATAPQLAASRFNHHIGPSITSRMERNLGGLLVTDDQLRREFNKLDVNGDGTLDAEEFKGIYACLEQFGVELTQQDLDVAVRKHGAVKGRVTFDQFCVLILAFVNH